MSILSDFLHIDLASAQSVLVPLNLEPEKQNDTLRLLLQSHRGGTPVTWAGGMSIFADLTLSTDGVATLMLSAAYAMCRGEIKMGETVYSMAVAVGPRMSDRPWYTLGRLYLNALLIRPEYDWASLGQIPNEFPWAAGFAWSCANALGEAGNLKLTAYAKLAAATAVNHCREAYVPKPYSPL